MVNVTAARTAKSLAATGLFVHDAAGGARLRAVLGRNFDELAAVPSELVAKHLDESAPAGARDVPGEVRILDHTLDVQLLDDDRAVALGVGGRQAVQNVFTLAPHLAVEAHDADLGLLSVLRSFLASTDDALSVSEAAQGRLEMFGILHEQAVGVTDQVREAAVDGNHRFRALDGFDRFDLADDGSEPLVAFAFEGAGFWFAFDRSMDDGAQVAELWEAQDVAVEPPSLWVWLRKAEEVLAASLPSRGTRKLLEAALPGLVELDKELSADVARDIGQPWGLFAEFGQLSYLVKRSGESPLIARSGQTHSALLVGKVPEPAQRRLPGHQPHLLDRRRVDTAAERLADHHVLFDDYETTSIHNRTGLLPALKDGVSAPQNR